MYYDYHSLYITISSHEFYNTHFAHAPVPQPYNI